MKEDSANKAVGTRYYLSYVEYSDHAALMLSQQDKPPEGPTKIMREVGFVPSGAQNYMKEKDKYMASTYKKRSAFDGFFRERSGLVAEDGIASKTMYASKDVSHRTFPISESEANQFNEIIDKYRNKNIKSSSQVTEGNNIKIVYGSNNYQFLRMNCKVFTMQVLKKLGLVEAMSLQDTTIQRPGTKDGLLTKVNKNQLTCPQKEAFIEKFGNVFNKTNIPLSSEASTNLAECRNNILKAGFSDNFDKNFNALMKYVTENRSSGNESEYKAQDELKEEYEKLKQAYKDDSLEFFWKTMPPTVKRKSFDHLSEEEKAMELINLRHKELTDCVVGIGRLMDNNILTEEDQDRHNETLQIKVVNEDTGEKEVIQIYGPKSMALDDFYKKLKTVDGTDNYKIYEAINISYAHLLHINREFEESLNKLKKQKGNGSDNEYQKAKYELHIKKQEETMNVALKLNAYVNSFAPEQKATKSPIKRLINAVTNYFTSEETLLKQTPDKVLNKKLKILNTKASLNGQNQSLLFSSASEMKKSKPFLPDSAQDANMPKHDVNPEKPSGNTPR